MPDPLIRAREYQEKLPEESWPYAVNFAERLPLGVTLDPIASNSSVQWLDANGNDVTNLICDPTTLTPAPDPVTGLLTFLTVILRATSGMEGTYKGLFTAATDAIPEAREIMETWLIIREV